MGEAAAVTVPQLEIEGLVFPPVVAPPGGSSKSLFLGGAGARGLQIRGEFVKFTAIGVYFEEAAVASLAGKWKGKTETELAGAVDFYRDIISGPFEKLTQVSMILPLTGKQYSEKVTENCVACWKAAGVYSDAEAAAVDKFKQVLDAETFPPGSSIVFSHSPSGSLAIAFSKSTSIPKEAAVVIENGALSEAVLESIVGEHGVSPAAKMSLARRLSELLKQQADDVQAASVAVAA